MNDIFLFNDIIKWTLDFPNTVMNPLAKITSDLLPCVVQINIVIHNLKIFRFKHYWIKQLGFIELVSYVWNDHVKKTSSVARISAKFKRLRYKLKCWGRGAYLILKD